MVSLRPTISQGGSLRKTSVATLRCHGSFDNTRMEEGLTSYVILGKIATIGQVERLRSVVAPDHLPGGSRKEELAVELC